MGKKKTPNNTQQNISKPIRQTENKVVQPNHINKHDKAKTINNGKPKQNRNLEENNALFRDSKDKEYSLNQDEEEIPEHLRSLSTTPGRTFEKPQIKLQKDSFWTVFFTSFDYVLRDLRKKQKQFKIGVMTIFIVVGFVTFLESLVQLAPAIIMMASSSTQGDFDFQFTFKTKVNEVGLGNNNYFQEPLYEFNDLYINDSQSRSIDEQFRQNFFSPLINFTKINTSIKNSSSNIGQTFPRWSALSKAFNPNTQNHTSAFMIAGNSKLERDIGVASGFPNILLKRGEIIATSDLLDILSINEGDIIEMNYDLFQLVALDLSKLKRIIFEYDQENQFLSQGEAFLKYFNFDANMTFDQNQYFNERIINSMIQKTQTKNQREIEKTVIDIKKTIDSKKDVKVAEILESFFRNFNEDDFILKINYTIAKRVEGTFGKWQSTMGNAYFVDSKYLLFDLLDMAKVNILKYMQRNNFDEEEIEAVEEIWSLIRIKTTEQSINDYAIYVNGHFDDRRNLYMKDSELIKHRVNDISRNVGLDANLTITTPILTQMHEMGIIKHSLDNILITVIFFLCLLSFILIYSLMQSDVEERTYEFAMLRTLGFRNRSLMLLLLIQGLLFSIPGIIMGFIIMFIFQNGAQVLLYGIAEFGAIIELNYTALFLGCLLGIALPIVSNIIPIKQALSHTLRNALDKFRAKADEYQISMIRMENMGISVNQIILSITLLLCGFMTFYYVPQAFIMKKLHMFTFLINLLLLLLILGMIMIAQILVPSLENLILDIMIFFKPQDRKMKPIVKKNLESHGSRNLKTSLMFTVTLSFLVFSGANFKQIQFFVVSLTKSIAGADLSISKYQFGEYTNFVLDEFKIREFLDLNLINKGGIIEDYAFQTQSLVEISHTRKHHGFYQWLISSGMQDELFVDLYGVEPNIMKAIDQEFFYLGESMKDPYKMNKNYGAKDIINMIYDVEQYAKYSQPYDQEEVLSGGEINQEYNVESEVYHLLVPEGLRSLSFGKLGQYVHLCIKDNEMIPQLGEVVHDNAYCNFKLRARILASIRKFPGFPSISGYPHISQYTPAVIMSIPQLKHLLEEVFKKHPERKEAFLEKMEDLPKSSYNLPKSKLYINLISNSTRFQRNVLKNNLLNYIKDDSVMAFDGQSFIEDTTSRMFMIEVFNVVITIICFTLGLFQLIVTISANIRDSMWELGVLRSMGMTKHEIMRVTIYESISNQLSSIILGFLIGLIIAVSLISQFLIFLELPFKLVLPYQTLIIVAIMSLLTMILGSYFGTRSLYKKEIASILKGLS